MAPGKDKRRCEIFLTQSTFKLVEAARSIERSRRSAFVDRLLRDSLSRCRYMISRGGIMQANVYVSPVHRYRCAEWLVTDTVDHLDTAPLHDSFKSACAHAFSTAKEIQAEYFDSNCEITEHIYEEVLKQHEMA